MRLFEGLCVGALAGALEGVWLIWQIGEWVAGDGRWRS
jgi:hypothetical protein